MEIDNNLLKEFAKITNDSEVKTENKYLRGTIVKNSGGKYVQLDGSSVVTPISELVDVEDGDRVLVTIENHKATIVGNFTFPPSARKEQEALDKAGAAQGAASQAGEKANAAQIKAQEASDKADTAINQSSIASVSANEAKQQAAEAINKANSAQENVQEAKDLATQASADATEAKNQASASQASSAEAQAEVTRLQNEVNSAKEDIDQALDDLDAQAGEIAGIKQSFATKVEVGETKAELETTITTKVGELETNIGKTYSTKTENVQLEGKLQSQITQNAEGLTSQASKIEKIEADTTEAQKDVADALSKASAAQTAATEAQTKANAAQTAANQATADATEATNKATIAQNAANAATAAANAADQAVQAAQGDLAEAKQNLESVTSRVDATEADIADAQAKVDAAQTSVNEALADAAEANAAATKAQEAADKAQTDAETAQGVANTAQQKADNAKTAADKAQSAADKAQQDVAALTKRVTSAETKIDQNAEAITLNANKTEEIGTKVDNIEIGGRNLVFNSDNYIENGTTIPFSKTYTYDINLETYNNLRNKQVTISLDVELIDAVAYSTGTNKRICAELSIQFTDGTTQYCTMSHWFTDTPITIKKRLSQVFTIHDKEITQVELKRVGIHIQNLGSGYAKIGRLKIELGNKPTDWTPAPEDIENELTTNYYNKVETDAKFKVESDRITSAVTRVETVEKGVVDAQADIDNLEIGGRNYILNSGEFKDTEYWSSAGATTLETIEYENKRCLHAIGPITQPKAHIIKFDKDYVYHAYIKFNKSATMSNSSPLHYHQWAADEITDARPSDHVGVIKTFTEYYVDKPGNKSIVPDTWHHLVLKFHTKTQEEVNKQYGLFRPFMYGIPVNNSSTGENGEYWLQWMKLEEGVKPTDWTLAPEDTETDITNAQNTAEAAQSVANNANTAVTEARTLITQLSDMIANLVTDANGGSLMTQTNNGWTFNMSSITGNLEAIQNAIENMNTDHSDTNDALKKLTDLVNDVANKTAYIVMATDENGDPCIELGKSSNPFRVRITNTAIDFMEGSTKIAYANNNTFYAEKMIVKNELQIGEGPGFVWRTRSNGNMGLVYISG